MVSEVALDHRPYAQEYTWAMMGRTASAVTAATVKLLPIKPSLVGKGHETGHKKHKSQLT